MVLTVLRVVLGLLFIVSGSIKISNYELFYHSVERFWILPAELNYFAMFTIPMVETVCGILLVMNIFRAWVTSVLIFLLGAFGAGKAINLYKGEQFSCECFGSLKILDRSHGYNSILVSRIQKMASVFGIISSEGKLGVHDLQTCFQLSQRIRTQTYVNSSFTPRCTVISSFIAFETSGFLVVCFTQ